MAQALMLAIGGVFIAALNQLVGGELRARVFWFTQRLLVLAIRRLPEPQQGRFAEEWTSHMNDIPGDVRKVLFARGCVGAARDMVAFSTAGKTNVSHVRNRAVELLRALKRSFINAVKEMEPPAKIDRTSGRTLIREGIRVKVGPTRPDGKPHPHAGKTGWIMRFINDQDLDPCRLGPASAMIRLDSGIKRREFIWVSLASLEVLPESAPVLSESAAIPVLPESAPVLPERASDGGQVQI